MNLIKEVKSARIGDHYYEVQHPSGLKILVYPKNDNNSTYAVFGTRYGSVDMAFHLKGEQEVHRVTAGITWSISFLKARMGMPLRAMPKQAQLQMPTPPSTIPAIYFPRRTRSTNP